MQIFDKSFEQFKQNAFKLAGFTLLYFMVLMVFSLVLSFIPIIGTLIYNVLVIIGLVLYVRVHMQITNGESSLCFNKASENIFPSSWNLIILNFIKGLFLLIVIIPCAIISAIIFATVSDSYYYSTESMAMLLIIAIFMLLVILLVAFVIELMLGFVSFVIIDKDFSQMSFKEAFSNGFKMMKGYRIKFIIVQLVNGILFFVGILMLGVGVLFTSALSTLIMLNLYKEAKEKYIGCTCCDENSIKLGEEF